MPDISFVDLPYQIALALSLASTSTGADFDYLMTTAARESSFQADARAATSSAQGLFQFIEETWLQTVKEEGGRFGLEAYAERIERTEDGRYVVADARHRKAILALRNDPKISALMAGAHAQRNAQQIAAQIGRQPTMGELYIAHFLGSADAARLIVLRATMPDLSAPDCFPKAAAANRSIFYAGKRPRSVSQVYAELVRRHRGGIAPTTPTVAATSAMPAVGSWESRMAEVMTLAEAKTVLAAAGFSTTGLKPKAGPVESGTAAVAAGEWEVTAEPTSASPESWDSIASVAEAAPAPVARTATPSKAPSKHARAEVAGRTSTVPNAAPVSLSFGGSWGSGDGGGSADLSMLGFVGSSD